MGKRSVAIGPELESPIGMFCDPASYVFNRLSWKRYRANPNEVDDLWNMEHRRLHLEKRNIFLVNSLEVVQVFEIFRGLNMLPCRKITPHQCLKIGLILLVF